MSPYYGRYGYGRLHNRLTGHVAGTGDACTVTDDFPGPALSGDWWTENSSGITNNRVESGTDYLDEQYVNTASAGCSSDMVVQADCGAVSWALNNYSFCRLTARHEAAAYSGNDWYGLLYYTENPANYGDFYLTKQVNGARSNLSGVYDTSLTSATLKITTNGTSLKGYVNGTERLSATDSGIPAGTYGGFLLHGSDGHDQYDPGNVYCDNWSREDL